MSLYIPSYEEKEANKKERAEIVVDSIASYTGGEGGGDYV